MRIRIILWLLPIGLWVLLGLHIPVAGAEDSKLSSMRASSVQNRKAQAHFRIGQSLYEAGRFEEAAAEFDSAYKLVNEPEILFNVYVAYRDASNLPKAIEALQRYLERVPESPDRLNLEARLRSMQAAHEASRAEVAAASAPATAEPATPTKQALPQPTPADSASTADSTDKRQESSNLLPWIVISVGGGAMVTGAVTGVLALDKISELEDLCPNDQCSTDAQPVKDDAATLVTVTDVLLIGGGVLATAGVLWLLLDDSEKESTPQRTVALSPSPQGVVGSFSLRF